MALHRRHVFRKRNPTIFKKKLRFSKMEKSQKELESLVQSQKQQLTRYETRLKGTLALIE